MISMIVKSEVEFYETSSVMDFGIRVLLTGCDGEFFVLPEEGT